MQSTCPCRRQPTEVYGVCYGREMRRASLLLVLFVPVLDAGCSKSEKKESAPSTAVPAASMASPLASAAPSTDGSAGSDAGGKGRDGGHGDRHEAVEDSGVPLKLDAKIGTATKTWGRDALDRVPRFTVGTDGADREMWSLRELAHTLVGPTARVVAVIGPRETRRVDAAAWADATRTPILHTTRRGTLKFRWADKDGKWADVEVVDVSRLEIEP